MSPSTLSEEGRRELIARQHRALYGPDGPGFSPHGTYSQEEGSTNQATQREGSGPQGMRGPSPRGMDPFGMPGQPENNQQAAEGKTTSPSSHQPGKAASPPTGEESSHLRTISKSTTAPVPGSNSMGPIGSRPNAQHNSGQSLNKRTTSPLPTTSLGYGFGVNEQNNERASSSQANANQKDNVTPAIGPWGTSSGVWGNKMGASVWS